MSNSLVIARADHELQVVNNHMLNIVHIGCMRHCLEVEEEEGKRRLREWRKGRRGWRRRRRRRSRRRSRRRKGKGGKTNDGIGAVTMSTGSTPQ